MPHENRTPREAVLSVLLAEDGFVAARDVAAVLDGEVDIGAVKYTLDALAQEGVLEHRATGGRKAPLYRMIHRERAGPLASEPVAAKPEKTRRRETLSNTLKNDRSAVDAWLATIPWDGPVRESLTAYTRGEISFADLARVLEREGYPPPRRWRSGR